MRVSGKGADVIIILVPLALLIAVGVGLGGGDSHSLFGGLERELWKIVGQVGSWIASLF